MRKTTWFPRHRKMKPFPATASQEKSHVRNWFTEKIYLFSGYFESLLLCREFSPAAVCRPLVAAASSAVGHRVQAHGFSRCGSRAPEGRLCGYGTRAQPLRSTWDPPGPGIEPASPAVQGGLPTTGPPRKSPTPVLLPGESHGQRCLVGCRPWGHTDSDTTETTSQQQQQQQQQQQCIDIKRV